LSVVVVSDYAAGGTAAWADLRSTLEALAVHGRQTELEVIVCEDERLAGELPADILDAHPGARLVTERVTGSYALKNAGARAARAPIVAILDADCRPLAGWAAALLEAFRREPTLDAVSGRTDYGGATAQQRIFALLTRAYLDPGRRGPTRFVSNNNAAWRRSTLVAHPLPEHLGPFAARAQSEAARRAGARFGFEPEMRAVHSFEGLSMEVDIRRNIGFGTIATRLTDPTLPYAWLTRAGRASIPAFVAGKCIATWGDCLRAFRAYGVSRYELPLALALAPFVHAIEASGMWAAFGDRPLERTAYR
jgi:cellulose synthase/poly-beta-1,6-N-acetylglucosamine synthase-like glycosyltransferase